MLLKALKRYRIMKQNGKRVYYLLLAYSHQVGRKIPLVSDPGRLLLANPHLQQPSLNKATQTNL